MADPGAIGEATASAAEQELVDEDAVLATAEQFHAADAGRLLLLDVRQIADKFQAARCQDRLSYMQHLEASAPQSKLAAPGSRWPQNVQPSLLRAKLCAGSNTLSSTLHASPTADGLGLWDAPDTAGSSGSGSSGGSSNPAAWQFGLALLQATHVGPTGLPRAGMQPLRRVARACVFDRKHHRFLGNVHSMLVATDRPHRGVGGLGACWTWDAQGPQWAPGPAPDGVADEGRQQAPHLGPVPRAALAGAANAGDAADADCGLGGAAAAAGAAAAGTALASAVASSSTVGGLGGRNACIVRCAGVDRDPVAGLRQLDGERLSLYVELNIATRLVAEDADVVPQDETLGAGLVDEATLCWALISLKRCAELTKEMTISVPLYCGSLYNPVLLSSVWAEKRKGHPVRSMFSSAPSPQLTFRAGPLPTRPAPLLPYRLMPHTLITGRDMACLLAAARLAVADALAGAAACAPGAASAPAGSSATSQDEAGPVCEQPACADGGSQAPGWHAPIARAAAHAGITGCGDAVLAALPDLLDDTVLQRELMAKWDARLRGLRQAAQDQAQEDCLAAATCGVCSCAGAAPPAQPSEQQLLAALRLSVLEVAPLLHCSSLPPAHIGNFAEHAAHRAAVAARFCRAPPPADGCCGGAAAAQRLEGGASRARHPVEVLSRAHQEFVHRPFDVAETRARLLGAQPRWCRC